MGFFITADNGADFPQTLVGEFDNFAFEPLTLTFGEEEFDGKTKKIGLVDFYKRIANKEYPRTSMVNQQSAYDFFENLLKQGHDILHISISSTLSGTHNSFVYAYEQLKDKFPKQKIYVVDSLCGGPGQALLCYYALMHRKSGMAIDEVYNTIFALRDRVCHIILMDDLSYLAKGGRISKEQAFLGTILMLKPILYFSTEGKLVNYCKTIGRKKALQKTWNAYLGNMDFSDGYNMLFLSHSNCLEDAELVAAQIKAVSPETEVYIDYLGTTTGSYAGIGTITASFIGKRKNLMGEN